MNQAILIESSPTELYQVDPETGEVLGIVTPKPEFVIDTDDAANWCLAKMLAEESAIAAIDTADLVRQARAILENAEAMKKDRQRRLDWLHTRFDAELGKYARGALEGAKTRTLKLLCGSISLRTVKGGLRVIDEADALETAKSLGWKQAIKTTEKFLISELDEEQRHNAETMPGFKLNPDEERVKIDTGAA